MILLSYHAFRWLLVGFFSVLAYRAVMYLERIAVAVEVVAGIVPK